MKTALLWKQLAANAERAIGAVGVAWVIGVTAAVVARDWARERKRVERVIADTTAEMNARADAIYAKRDAMLRAEFGEPTETPTDA